MVNYVIFVFGGGKLCSCGLWNCEWAKKSLDCAAWIRILKDNFCLKKSWGF